MAKAYIANRPVRFDRNYKVGEVIPDGVISRKMGRKLVEMGRILHVDLPDTGTNAPPPQGNTDPPTGGEDGADKNTQGKTEDAPESESDGAESPADSDNGEGSINTSEDAENAQEGESDGADGEKFTCEECGRTFSSANALSAHSRVHKK